MSERKPVIKYTDMAASMQKDAVDCFVHAMEKYNVEKDIAAYVKREFDKKHKPTWHCIVGRDFHGYVHSESRRYIYFCCGGFVILLFKSNAKCSECGADADYYNNNNDADNNDNNNDAASNNNNKNIDGDNVYNLNNDNDNIRNNYDDDNIKNFNNLNNNDNNIRNNNDDNNNIRHNDDSVNKNLNDVENNNNNNAGDDTAARGISA